MRMSRALLETEYDQHDTVCEESVAVSGIDMTVSEEIYLNFKVLLRKIAKWQN